MSEPEFYVGAKAYVFDENRRVYEKDPHSKNFSRTIYREHFREVVISGETSRSWLDDNYRPTKYLKNGSRLLTLKQVEDACFCHENRISIANKAKSASASQLKEIAQIIGYSL